jgi:hypothetical protein
MIGKLLTQLDADYRNNILPYLVYTINLNYLDTELDYDYYTVGGVSLFTLENPDVVEGPGIIQIGNELLYYKYYEEVSGEKRLYLITRGYRNTPIEQHNPGSFIYQYTTEIIKEYDSLNIRDISLTDYGIELNQSKQSIKEIKGVDVLLQDIKLTMINIGNDILNKQDTFDTILQKDILSSFYLDGFADNPLGISNVVILSIDQQQSNPNKLRVVAEVETRYQTYRNLEFYISTGRRTI